MFCSILIRSVYSKDININDVDRNNQNEISVTLFIGQMMKYNSLSTLEWFLAFFLVINGNSVYRACIGMDTPITVITAMLIAYISLLSRSLMPVKNTLIMPHVIMAGSFLYIVITKHQITTFFFLYIISFPLLIDYFYRVIVYRRLGNLFYKISDIVFFLTVVGLFLWYLGPITNQIEENCSIRIRWEHDMTLKGYNWLLFKSQIEDGTYLDNSIIWRNSSIFTESPMYNLWLCFALVVELFLRKRLNYIKSLFLLLGIASTLSTTGVLCVIGIVILYLYTRLKVTFISKIPFIVKILFLTVVIYYGYQWSNGIMTLKSDTSSYIARMRDYEMSFAMFRNHPLWGIGFGNQLNHTLGYSNSLVSILAQGGLWLFLIVYAPVIYCIIKAYRKSYYYFVSLALFFIFISTTTVFHNRYLFLLIPALLYAFLEFYFSQNKKVVSLLSIKNR